MVSKIFNVWSKCLNLCALRIFVCCILSCKVKTGVVGVPCGIEGSMVNEFVEALDSEGYQEDAT